MSAFIEPIEVAVFMFPFLALLLSLPIFVKQYRQYGRFILSRGIIIYTFIFYLLPNVLGRVMGQLAKGLNSLNHHIQQMALLFFFLISGYFLVFFLSLLTTIKIVGFLARKFYNSLHFRKKL